MSIRAIKPKYLFITCDGPKPDHEELVIQTKKVIEENIDWDCEVFKNYSSVNLGSYINNSRSLTWVFENVNNAIILEDDCIPCESFFYFCQELLYLYEQDERIALISGNNFTGLSDINQSYIFSRYGFIWGWATWRRFWNNIDFSMRYWKKFRSENGLRTRFDKIIPRKHWLKKFDDMYMSYLKYGDRYGQHWDRKLNMYMHLNSQYSIIPKYNLVKNVGYGSFATNCKSKSAFHDYETKDIEFPLVHPNYIYPNINFDDIHEKLRFSGTISNYVKRCSKNFLIQIINNLKFK